MNITQNITESSKRVMEPSSDISNQSLYSSLKSTGNPQIVIESQNSPRNNSQVQSFEHSYLLQKLTIASNETSETLQTQPETETESKNGQQFENVPQKEINFSSFLSDRSQKSSIKDKRKSISVPQKSDEKSLTSIEYIDELTNTTKRYEIKQNLIRPNKSQHPPPKSIISDVKKIAHPRSKDMDSSILASFKPPFDPLDIFDDEEREVFASFHKERSSGKLLTTHNPFKASYRIKITQSSIMTDVSRVLYPEFDTIFSGLVELNYGTPKAMRVTGNKFFFVGTSLGNICLFDYAQKFQYKFCTGKEKEFGPVTCLEVSVDMNYLLAGYESGAIVVWDVNEKKLIKTLHDVSKNPIVSLEVWKSSPLCFISIDAVGNLYANQLEKIMLYYHPKSKAIFPKNVGLVTNVRILNRHPWCHGILSQEALNQTLTAIGSTTQVYISSIDQNFEATKLCTFPRPSEVSEGSFPWVSWGYSNFRSKENEKSKIYLLLAWGKMVYLFELVEKEGRIIFPVVAHVKLQFEIIYCGWLQQNLVFLIDNKSLIHIIHTTEFIIESYLSGDSANDSADLNITSEARNKEVGIEYVEQISDTSLFPQKCFLDEKGVCHEIFQNTITHMNGEIMILGKTSFCKIKLLTWKEYLTRLLEESQWLMFLTVAIEVYRRNIKELAEIPIEKEVRRKKMQELIEENVLKFIEEKLFYETDEKGEKKIIKDENYRSEAIVSVMDFLIELEFYDLLFDKLKKIFMSLRMNEEFLKNIEPFVKLNKIKNIPDQVLREIVCFYTNKDKHKIMQQMILNLDVKKLDILGLQTLCLEINLNAALIHIVMEQEDVIIPFVKLINEHIKGPSGARSVDDVRKSGYQSLWLLKMCFKGRLCFTTKMLPDTKWRNIIENILTAVFEKEYLRELFVIEPTVAINLMLLLFTGEAARIVDDISENTKENSESGALMDLHESLFRKIFDCLTKSFTGDDEKKLKGHFGFFVMKIIRTWKYRFIDKGLCTAYATYFLKNPKALLNELLIMNFKMTLPHTNQKGEPIIFFEEFTRNFTPEFASIEKNELILALIRYADPKDEDLRNVIKISELSPFTEVTSYLYFLDKQYKRSFETFLPGTIDKWTRVRVFKYLAEYLSILEQNDNESFKEFKGYVLKRMRDLVVINCELTKQLIERHFKSEEQVVVLSLSSEPEVQLDYLEKMLEGRQQGDFIDDKLLVLHIELLCRLKDKKNSQNKKRQKVILEALMTSDYPQDDCVEICKKYQIKDAWAYLERKRGGSSGISQALSLQMEIFEEYVLKCLESKPQITQKHIKKLKQPLNICIDIMLENDDIESEKQKKWFIMLDKISSFEMNIDSKYKNNPKLDIAVNAIDELLENFLYSMVRNISLDSLLEEMKTMSSQFNIRKFKEFLVKILDNKKHQHKTIFTTKALLISDLIEISIRLEAYSKLGLDLESAKEKLAKEQKVLAFGCDHIFYNLNSDQKFCLACQQDSIAQILTILTTPKGMAARKGAQNSSMQSSFKFSQPITSTEESTKDRNIRVKRTLKRFDQLKNEETLKFFEFSKLSSFS